MPSANTQRNNELEMTAVSVFYDAGVNPLRKEATRKAVQHWMLQSHLPKEFLFIELGFDGQFTFSSQDFPEQIHYIRIDGTERNKYLFQKEHLWNIAAKMATYEKLMFIDSDVAPIDDQDWFRKVYRTLDKCLFTQGFRIITYLDENDRPSEYVKYSIVSNKNYPSKYISSGNVFCTHKNLIWLIGGFNYMPFGNACTLFLHEIGVLQKNIYWCRLCRRDDVAYKSQLMCMTHNLQLNAGLDVDIFHFNHKECHEISYERQPSILLDNYPWNGRMMSIGKNGLLEWSNSSNWFKRIAKNIKMFISGKVDVIVSLTSFPDRFKDVGLITQCLDSLVNQQTKYTFHIVLNIFKYDIPMLPSELVQYCWTNSIEILPNEEDLKGHKKYFYVMQKYKDVPILVVDDDLVFFDNMIESLMDKYMQDKNAIWTGWCHFMNLSKDGHLIYDSTLNINHESEVPSFIYKFGSGSGSLIPPNLIDNFQETLRLIKDGDIIYHDELVIKKLALDKKIKVGLCKNKKYKCVETGWLRYAQFIKSEITSLVWSAGNLHTINCTKIEVDGTSMYRGTNTEMRLFKKYIITSDEVKEDGR